jgi:hypothetical protein
MPIYLPKYLVYVCRWCLPGLMQKQSHYLTNEAYITGIRLDTVSGTEDINFFQNKLEKFSSIRL